MNWLTAFLVVLTLGVDWLVRRRMIRHGRPRCAVTAFTLFALVADTLPLLFGAVAWLFTDNTTPLVFAGQWVMFAYVLLVAPRMIYALFRFASPRRSVHLLGAAVAAGAVGLLIWGATAGRSRIVVNRLTLTSARLPEAFDGFRIVQFSDLHLGTLVHPERELGRLVDRIEALKPDLIVFSGDLVNIRYTELDSAAMRILGRLKAPFGVVSNIGNHDVGYYIRDSLALPHEVNLSRLIRRQEAMGWRVLDDRTEYLRRGGDSISLSAISFRAAWRNHRHAAEIPDLDLAPVYQGVPASLFNLSLTHAPQLWQPILEAGYGDLTLAGHVHSMQMKLRLGRRAFSPARLLYPQWSGLYERGGRYLYINDGIGYIGYPVRLGAWPEITLIELRNP